MSPAALLADLEARGVTFAVAGDRLRATAPKGTLTPSLRATLEARKPELLRVLAYREAVRSWWTLTAGPAADQTALAETWPTLVKLRDEVGEPAATALHRRWARAWHQETGRCPWCGEAGPYHDPERDGETA